MPEDIPELVECRACTHQISVKAKSCPNCGDRCIRVWSGFKEMNKFLILFIL